MRLFWIILFILGSVIPAAANVCANKWERITDTSACRQPNSAACKGALADQWPHIKKRLLHHSRCPDDPKILSRRATPTQICQLATKFPSSKFGLVKALSLTMLGRPEALSSYLKKRLAVGKRFLKNRKVSDAVYFAKLKEGAGKIGTGPLKCTGVVIAAIGVYQKAAPKMLADALQALRKPAKKVEALVVLREITRLKF